MSHRSDMFKIRWALIVIVLVIVSVCMSWKELKYMLWARTADGQVQRVEVLKNRSTNETVRINAVEYTFEDSGMIRKEWSSVPSNWDPVASVKVEYFSGKQEASRLQGTSGKFWVWIMLGMIGVGGAVFWKISRPA